MLTFKEFQNINKARNDEFCNFADDWKAENWSNALAGEVGEFCNLVKKFDRFQKGYKSHNTFSSRDEFNKAFGEELADVLCYTFLCASYFELDLESELINKFNKVSKRFDSNITL